MHPPTSVFTSSAPRQVRISYVPATVDRAGLQRRPAACPASDSGYKARLYSAQQSGAGLWRRRLIVTRTAYGWTYGVVHLKPEPHPQADADEAGSTLGEAAASASLAPW